MSQFFRLFSEALEHYEVGLEDDMIDICVLNESLGNFKT